MKFTIVSHASLYIEAKGKKILIDPWLVGSSYWRSWWNFPEPDLDLVRSLKPDFIYITHLHWDHYHGPSLRRFDQNTTILLPKAPTTRMIDDLRAFRFKNVVELDHGKPFEAAPGLEITSYQFGPVFIDSAIVVSDGQTTLLNANDTKLFGWPLKQVMNRYPKIDFAFRSHSSASPLPYCIDGYKEFLRDLRTQQEYAEEFTAFCLAVDARYAIPFASNHCFLHRETFKYNDTAADPLLVEKVFSEKVRELDLPNEVKIMPPGSSWDSDTGFVIQPFDYSKKAEHIERLLEKHRETLESQYQREEKTQASFQAFEKYFTKFLSALPWFFRLIVGFRFAFKISDRGAWKLWIVDMKQRRVYESIDTAGCNFVVETTAFVINDCCRKRMFNTWGASKRLKIHATREKLSSLSFFFTIMDYYENDGLPLRKNLSRRQLGVRLRRWREAVETVRFIIKYKILRKPFVVSNLYPVRRLLVESD